MRRLPGAIVVVLICGMLLTGCAPKAIPPINLLAKSHEEAAVLDEAFRPGSRILSGFDQPDPSGQWRMGDRILLGFKIDKGGQKTVRFVQIELKSGVLPRGAEVFVVGAKDTPPPGAEAAESASGASRPKSVYVRLAEGEDPALIGHLPAPVWGMTITLRAKDSREESFNCDSDAVFIAVDVFDENGQKIKTAGTLAPEAYLRSGLFTVCDLMHRKRAGEAVDQSALLIATANALPPLYGLGEVIRETPPLSRIIQPILPPPPIWALLIPPKLDLSLAEAGADVQEDQRPLPALAGGRLAYLMPLSIRISREPALRCLLSVIDPSPPFHLCAGVAGIDGAQIQDPSCRFVMRLLAARRSGTGSSSK